MAAHGRMTEERLPDKTQRTVTLTISEEDAEDVREQGECNVGSYEQPGERDDRQTWEWHQGKRLIALADRMDAALRGGAE